MKYLMMSICHSRDNIPEKLAPENVLALFSKLPVDVPSFQSDAKTRLCSEEMCGDLSSEVQMEHRHLRRFLFQ
ncbi:hypothetical protein T4D_16508 [Trichinella pseudospiralis]|uniref:Uncharacterized protein n=1 Tax=Trichinella pseudospiralis TaxID=6337 RepID=A0A0V1F398_TRIPS|nr:hypothetical protein T4D_16508 [Trichinella pseudospiralis]